MLSGKQRSILKSMANTLDATVYIGKDGVSEDVVMKIDTELFNHELIKIKKVPSADINPKILINELAKILQAEPIVSLGGVMVLYRKSNKKGVNHIEI